MEMRFPEFDTTIAERTPVPLDFATLCATLCANQAASETAKTQTHIDQASIHSDQPAQAAIVLMHAEADWKKAVRHLQGSFDLSTASSLAVIAG